MTSPPAELVIFDCDGVLIDSERLAVRVDVQMLHDLGWPLTEPEVIERFVGRSDKDTKAAIVAQLGHPLPDGWDEEINRQYRALFAAELVPVEGISDALDAISLPTCVASSGTHDHLRYTLGLTGLSDRFDGRIFSAEDVREGKPAPDLFLYAADRMGVTADRCVVVEDSRNGVLAARAAGMRVLAFSGGLTPADLLVGAGTTVFGEMRELPGLIDREIGRHSP